jgi:uncharacterized protein YndB with AHSA1/START domain
VPDPLTVQREIAAPADQVWAMVADVTRMHEWSPENESAVWLQGATGPAPGARFRGVNRNGRKKWNTVSTVVEAVPGQRFSFRVTAKGFRVSEWSYEFEPTPVGCRVTERWTDERGALVTTAGRVASGVADRATHNRAGMESTLDRLKAAAESAHRT